MISLAEKTAFERAFVATRYLLDGRGDDLLSGLPDPGREARELAQALGAAERSTRATVLAPELARLLQALEARRLA